MESYVDEIIQEWYTKLKEIKENLKAEGLLLKDLRIKFMFIKKYFEKNERIVFSKKQKNFLNVKSSSLTALNLMKEKEMMKIKKAYKEIIELEEVDDPFKPKQEKINKEIKKPEVNLEEKLRVIKKPKEKSDKGKGVHVENVNEKVVNGRSDQEKIVKEKPRENVVREKPREKIANEKPREKIAKEKVANEKSNKLLEDKPREKIANGESSKANVVQKKPRENVVKDRPREKVANEKDDKLLEDKHRGKVFNEKGSKEDPVNEKLKKESVGLTNDIKLIKQPLEDSKPIEKVKEPIDKNDNPVKVNKNEVKNKMKNLLNAVQSKSQKNGDQNKENIPDHSILVEDGEVKLFIVNKKKRVKDFLKETKRKKNKVECDDKEKVNEEEIQDLSPPKEVNTIKDLNPLKEANPFIKASPFEDRNPLKDNNTPKDLNTLKEINLSNQLKHKDIPKKQPTNIFDRTSEFIKKRILKNKTPEKVYDVGTNRFISESNLKNVNLKNLCRSPLKDGLYKNIIDKERRSKSRIGMNKFIPKTPVPEINSDEEENYSGLITDKEIEEKLKNQNHEEIEKYFNSELSIDIELLFPNIKEISNESPNKWG